MSTIKNDFTAKARPLAKSLIDFALKEGKPYGLTDVRIDVSANDNLEIEVEGGAVTKVVSGAGSAVYISLHADDRLLGFRVNSLDYGVLSKAIAKAVQVLPIVPANPHSKMLDGRLLFKGPAVDLGLFDPAQATREEMIARALEMGKTAFVPPQAKSLHARSVVTRFNQHVLALATNGLNRTGSTTIYGAGVLATLEDHQGKKEAASEFGRARRFSDLDSLREAGKAASIETASRLGAILPVTGKMPVVLNNDAATAFFRSVYSAISGGRVYRNMTFLKGKVGQQVMSDDVTIIDDPRLYKGLNSGQADGIGVEQKEITFVEKGVLKSYLVDKEEASQLGIPMIGRNDGITNTRVLPGSQTVNELIADIKEGVYIKGFKGGTVSVNDGTYSREAFGLLIKDGKITSQAVAGFAVAGNMKEMFMNVALADDTPALPNPRHAFAAPTTRINGVTIAAK